MIFPTAIEIVDWLIRQFVNLGLVKTVNLIQALTAVKASNYKSQITNKS